MWYPSSWHFQTTSDRSSLSYLPLNIHLGTEHPLAAATSIDIDSACPKEVAHHLLCPGFIGSSHPAQWILEKLRNLKINIKLRSMTVECPCLCCLNPRSHIWIRCIPVDSSPFSGVSRCILGASPFCRNTEQWEQHSRGVNNELKQTWKWKTLPASAASRHLINRQRKAASSWNGWSFKPNDNSWTETLP